MTNVTGSQDLTIAEGLAGQATGEGPRILWLHGYTLDCTSFRTMWSLLPGYRHYGVDLPGHGRSAPIAAAETLRTLGRRVADFCRAEGIEHLVALSFGTLTGTQVAIEEPDLFSSITLAAPSLAGGPQDPEVGLTYARLGALFRRLGPGPALTDAWMSAVAWRGVEKQPELQRAMRALVERHRWSELRDWGMQRLLQPAQTPEQLGQIRSPVLVLIGELDLPACHACTAILDESLRRCRRVTLAGTGHLCMLESPEPSALAIRDHLLAHAGGRGAVRGQ